MATINKQSAAAKALYKLLIFLGKVFGFNGAVLVNKRKTLPLTSFYSLQAIANNGSEINFKLFVGKKVLIVNTASNCGYTPQFNQLKQLDGTYKELQIIAFPSNDFKEQEKGSDEEIASFCKLSFGIKFPLAKKTSVIKSSQQNAVFAWLTHKEQNGWCNKQPDWNFSKYLINEQGILTHYFGPGISPLSENVVAAISK